MVAAEQVRQLAQGQHPDPFAVLGPHPLERNGAAAGWVVRAFLPHAQAAWVVLPAGDEHPMQAAHHSQFFACELTGAPEPYWLRVREGDCERVIADPYAFGTPKLSDFDRYLFGEGTHYRLYDKLGAHPLTLEGIEGVYFAVWAPNARGVALIGDFNRWDARAHPMGARPNGLWELFLPQAGVGDRYKYAVTSAQGETWEKTDPLGFQQEVRPKTASLVADLDGYSWQDRNWLTQRRQRDPLREPIAIYELHLGAWLHAPLAEPAQSLNGSIQPVPVPDNPHARFLTYYELAEELIPYVRRLGFTHIELLPVAEHALDGSWGYQVTGYYACTSRYGTPQDFMYLVDCCHQSGIGVILDWVPGHFPKDGHGLARFDGTPLYEYADPRQGEHAQWDTLVFNYGRNEVRNFLVANALFWFDKYHIDGIRVDAVASMLYLDYHRPEGQWLPNAYGGREHLEGIAFLRQMNAALFARYPGALAIAEESSAWPQVTQPIEAGGLGFNLSWNMDWMHDVLDYFSMDPGFRQFHQRNITFGLSHAFDENYTLALSHDEVAHGKHHLAAKMPGDTWQKLATLRCLHAYTIVHPGKKMLFAGMELGQWREWDIGTELAWELLQQEAHQRLQQCLCDLNRLYYREPALHRQDCDPAGLEWIDGSDARHSVVAFIRRDHDSSEFAVAVCNLTPQPHSHYRVGVPEAGFYREVFNSDSREYGGSHMGNLGGKWSEQWAFHNYPHSLDLCLPPLGVLILKPASSPAPAVMPASLLPE